MNKWFVVVIGLAVVIGLEVTSSAVPCRRGVPDCRRPHPPPPPPPPPPTAVNTIYQRAVPARPPAKLDRANLVRLLVGSAWTRLGSREQIRFVVEPLREGHFARPPEEQMTRRDRSIRAVALDLVRDGRLLFVNIDGALYTVSTCQMPLRAVGRRQAVVLTTCLESLEVDAGFGGRGYGGATYGGR